MAVHAKICLLVCVLAFVFVLPLSKGESTPSDRPVVSLTNGQVIGWIVQSNATGKNMKAFKGIPFAKPPVKELRFMDPVPADNWAEAKNLSTDDAPACPQPISIYGNIVDYSEDCLYINVFTPQDANSTSQLPVMVWIYGGAFIVGSSSSVIYGPDFLVEQGVIFVSMNYRVGVLGFLNLGTDKVPGNAGLKDQWLAMKWVQTEIANFGGDPAKVTLFGESAGAASVMLHYLSPRSESLFSRAIAESGNALAEWPFLEDGFIERAKAFSANINCPLVNDQIQLSCLQNATVDTIIANQILNLPMSYSMSGSGLPFVPSLEKPSANALLSDTPSNLLKNLITSTRTKPALITGINRDEGILQLSLNKSTYMDVYNNLQYFISEKYRKNQSADKIQKDVQIIKKEYFNNIAPSLSNVNGYIKLFTDKLFALSTANFSRQLATHATVYLYEFDFHGDFNMISPVAKALNVSDGVAHGDELSYIFFFSSFYNQSTFAVNTTSVNTLKKMVKLWTNFAKTGNPTPDGTTDDVLESFLWHPITDGAYRYMKVSEGLTMSTDNFRENELKMWSEIESSSARLRTSIVGLMAVMLLLILFYEGCERLQLQEGPWRA